MKSKNILLITLVAVASCIPTYAQFNTIGRVNRHRHVLNKQNVDNNNNTNENELLSDSSFSDSTFQTDSIITNEPRFLPFNVSFPLKHIHIGSGFGMRKHPIMHKYCMHNGVDLSARYEDVYSMFPGTVIRVGQDKRSGKYVTVQSANYTISYCHLTNAYVKVDDFVYAGDVIAKSGNTGMSTGPHLHLTTKKDGKAINPTILLDFIRSVKEESL